MEIWNGVFIADGAPVPVVRDLFPAFGPFKVTGGASDGEGLENFLVEDALVKVLVCHMVERLFRSRSRLTSGYSADLFAIKR